MADRNDSERDRGQDAGGSDDQTEQMERKLSRAREDLPGDMEENRNLTGSTTWETLSTEADEGEQHSRKGQAQSPAERTHNEPPKQQKRGGRG